MWPRYEKDHDIQGQIEEKGYFAKNGLRVSSKFLNDLANTDTLKEFKEKPQEIMVIHSERDPRIPYSNITKYVNEAERRKLFRHFSCDSHSFKPHETFVPQVVEQSISFFNDTGIVGR